MNRLIQSAMLIVTVASAPAWGKAKSSSTNGCRRRANNGAPRGATLWPRSPQSSNAKATSHLRCNTASVCSVTIRCANTRIAS